MSSGRESKKGLTLIELITALAIFVMIATVVGTVLVSTIRTYGIQKELADKKDAANYIMNFLKTEVQETYDTVYALSESQVSSVESDVCYYVADGRLRQSGGSTPSKIPELIYGKYDISDFDVKTSDKTVTVSFMIDGYKISTQIGSINPNTKFVDGGTTHLCLLKSDSSD